jgi:hypothetical protein
MAKLPVKLFAIIPVCVLIWQNFQSSFSPSYLLLFQYGKTSRQAFHHHTCLCFNTAKLPVKLFAIIPACVSIWRNFPSSFSPSYVLLFQYGKISRQAFRHRTCSNSRKAYARSRVLHLQMKHMKQGEKMAAPWLRRLVAGFPPRRPGFEPSSGHVGFVVDKAALGQGFSEHVSPANSHSTDCSTLIIYHPGLVQ